MTESISNIGRIFRQRRRELGYTQESLGKKIGVGRSQICKIESGKGLTFETINKVATALDSTVKVEVRPYHAPDADKMDFTMMAINKFAQHHGLTKKNAANYLLKYKGIEFLDDCYAAEHTLSFDDCVADLTKVCQNNGGGLK